MFQAYGDSCACCGEREPKFLGIDHTNGGGNTHRREVGRGNVYWWNSPNPSAEITMFEHADRRAASGARSFEELVRLLVTQRGAEALDRHQSSRLTDEAAALICFGKLKR